MCTPKPIFIIHVKIHLQKIPFFSTVIQSIGHKKQKCNYLDSYDIKIGLTCQILKFLFS